MVVSGIAGGKRRLLLLPQPGNAGQHVFRKESQHFQSQRVIKDRAGLQEPLIERPFGELDRMPWAFGEIVATS